jgi:hypothetical protein
MFSDTFICYFPKTKTFIPDISLKYLEVEYIAKRNKLLEEDLDYRTIIDGGRWFALLIPNEFPKNLTLNVIENIVRTGENCIFVAEIDDKNIDIKWFSEYKEHCEENIVQYLRHYKEVVRIKYS